MNRHRFLPAILLTASLICPSVFGERIFANHDLFVPHTGTQSTIMIYYFHQ